MIAEEDLDRMHYLKAVIKDWDTSDYQCLGNWKRSCLVGKKSNEFRPERFLNNSVNYQGLQFDWIPFGAGRRSCPGIQFSVPVMELALANIVYKFDMVFPKGIENEDLDMSEEFGITIHRKSSLFVLVSPRC
ncbi:hypothetical protein L1987_48180 [Smallanthus sonchifolius]|uniref:Uncharacterized protein n=1 Tax=Smallanthus sonchifolius TaxID=185202 RepID=A0ACB9FS53_9ASTR|nr:hypothetical protein L1987_48180 [Smallanthus sonchifolius]